MIDGMTVIDAHCHIYPEKIAERAVAGTDGFYGTVAACDGTLRNLLEEGETAGVDRFIVQSVATTPKQVTSINEYIASEVANANGKLVGLGTIHPESSDPEGDVNRIVSLGLKGVKIHPDIQKFKIDDYRFLHYYELLEQAGLPILMHTGDFRYDYSNPNRLKPVCEIFKGLTVIGAHFGGWSIWTEACRELAGLPNLYVDCSSSLPYLTKEQAVEIIRTYGADRVLFGTDFPMWSPIREMESFCALPLTKEERSNIFSKNAVRVFGL